MGGPWFAVRKSGDDWVTLDEMWLTNGETSVRAKVEYRVRFDAPNPNPDNTNPVEH